MKIIHCADIHLDSPMGTHMTAEKSEMRNAEVLRSFIKLTEYAAENQVRAVIIAGDLFDGDVVKHSTVDAVLSAFEKAYSVDFLYLPGNHDSADRILTGHHIPHNLKLFDTTWRTYSYDDVDVSGIALTDRNAGSLYDEVPHAENKINIVALHGQIGNDFNADTVRLNSLKDKKIDYLALGHIHSYFVSALGTCGMYCYSGCLEGRGFDECGKKGFVELSITNGLLQHRFVEFANRELHRIEIDVTGALKTSDVERMMKNSIDSIPSRDMVEFILQGALSPDANISMTDLNSFITNRFFFTKIKDESRLAISYKDYKNVISLKGEFIRTVLSGNDSDEDKDAIIRIGLAALRGEDIRV